jgi:Spy/CpxP family protein refolding chaperone
MKRGWFLVLALSVGLNAGLLYSALSASPRGLIPGFHTPPPFLEGGHPDVASAPGPGAAPENLQCRLDHMARSLELDEHQRASMQQVLDETMPRIMAAREDVRQARQAVQAEYGADRPEPARVHQAVRSMNTAQARLDSLVAETMLREIAVLGPEQMHRYLACLPWGRCQGAPCQPAGASGSLGPLAPGLCCPPANPESAPSPGGPGDAAPPDKPTTAPRPSERG